VRRVEACPASGYAPGSVLWYVLFFLVFLKIPSVYLGYVIWWSVKDPPDPAAGGGGGGLAVGGGDSDGGSRPRRPPRTRRRGPHGSPTRRPHRGAPARARSRKAG
jgi:hypothetical protein